MPEEEIRVPTETLELRTQLDAPALLAETRRLLADGRERVASSLVSRHGETSLASYLEKQWRAAPSDAALLDQLCRELWRQGEISHLESVLAPLSTQETGPEDSYCATIALGWRSLLAAKRQDSASLEADLSELVRRVAPLGDFPTYLERELASLRCLRPLDTVLEAAVAEDSVGMSFAALHVRRACHRRQWEVRQHFPTWIARASDRAAEPVGVFLDSVGDAREAAGSVPAMIAEYGPWMSQQTAVYGQTGFALVNSGLYAEAARWLDGCEQRGDLRGWVALNLVLALWKQDDYAKAGRVSSAVIDRGLHDSTWNRHVTSAAYGHALAGRGEAALAALARLEDDSAGARATDFAWVLELARSITRVQRLARRESKRVFHEERSRLRLLAPSLVSMQEAPAARHRYHLALDAMARHGRLIVWPWQRAISQPDSPNPLRGGLWVGGVLLLILAGLRSCIIPQQGSLEMPIEESAAPAAPSANSPQSTGNSTLQEIDKIMNKPSARK
ncbi:MAG: hypothetical protein IPK32_19305 [Verrucomicrobiaceae bacterium]|nr:hypothetical protein [Verrucomicrobiaceae bacterium]